MSATRKIPANVQSQDIDQLKSLFGNSKISKNNKATEKEAAETGDFPDGQKADKAEKELSGYENISGTEEKKENVTTTVGIRMTAEKKQEMKSYFIQRGTTMSQGILDSFALLKKLENDGTVIYKDGLLKINEA